MTQHRLPHAVLDLPSRRHKALKIERLLGLRAGDSPIRMLEIGCGSGGISHYFATHPSLRCEVQAVDVHDSRLVMGGYAFALVEGVALPFADESFDVVISNHVVEHVGPACAQREHLRELHRIMAPGGIAYLAVPNRWMLVEPHYRLAFLSWWPRRWRDAWLRLWRRGGAYDCEPLALGEAERLLDDAGLAHANVCIAALRETVAIEGNGGWLARGLAALPEGLLAPLLPVFPTLCFVLRRKPAG
jgi:SAM-dependent methyltransferase